MKYTAYRIVEEVNVERFERSVNELLAQGWQPLGGLVIAPRDENEISHAFYQALVRADGVER